MSFAKCIIKINIELKKTKAKNDKKKLTGQIDSLKERRWDFADYTITR